MNMTRKRAALIERRPLASLILKGSHGKSGGARKECFT